MNTIQYGKRWTLILERSIELEEQILKNMNEAEKLAYFAAKASL